MADPSDTSQVLPTAPPPPQEVKVRTLKSDLASIAQSGGGLPRYANVKIAAKTAPEKTHSANGLLMTIAIVVLLVIIAAITFYFVNQLVLKK